MKNPQRIRALIPWFGDRIYTDNYHPRSIHLEKESNHA